MNGHTEGEEWAASELRRLRNQRFTPSAWIQFLANSYKRAKRTRAERPGLARQAHRWSGVGAVAGVGLCAVKPHMRRQLRGFAGWWLAVATMLDWHLGMVEGDAGELRESLSGADALTMTRLWMLPFLAASREPQTFTSLILAAAFTDTLDGPLARQHGTTRLGRDLDRTADVLTMMAAASAARREGWIRGPVARLLILRGTLPIAVVAGSYLLRAARPEEGDFRSFRQLAPMLTAGLALAPTAQRTGNTLVAIAAAGPLITAATQISHRRSYLRTAGPGSSPTQKVSRSLAGNHRRLAG